MLAKFIEISKQTVVEKNAIGEFQDFKFFDEGFPVCSKLSMASLWSSAACLFPC